jgi:hypothetical protein
MLPVFLFVAKGISFVNRNNADRNNHFDRFNISIEDDEYEAFKKNQIQRL